MCSILEVPFGLDFYNRSFTRKETHLAATPDMHSAKRDYPCIHALVQHQPHHFYMLVL